MKLEEVFDEVNKQMYTDLAKARKALTHPGLKGDSFEDIFRTFLRKYLPMSLDVSSGILVDANGTTTRQLDVIISDAARTPIFFEQGNVRVIPVEGCYAVIEVKANLDATELDRVFTNMLSVRALEKKAFTMRAGSIRESTTLYGKEWDIPPVMYFVFAFGGSRLEHLGELVNEEHQKRMLPHWSRIDTICVLDQGVI